MTLPRYMFDWLRNSRDGEWTIADTGMFVVMMQQFENRTPLLAGATFEEEDGEPVLIVPGAIGGDLRFQDSTNGNSPDSTDSGHVRVREALSACVRNKWLTAEQAGGQRCAKGRRTRRLLDRARLDFRLPSPVVRARCVGCFPPSEPHAPLALLPPSGSRGIRAGPHGGEHQQ